MCHKPRKILSLLLLLILPSGCATQALRERQALAQKLSETKKSQRNALKIAVTNNTLKEGTAPAAIQSEYGSPDDIFRSGSGNSLLEIWSYEKTCGSTDYSEFPIRLYFNNNKLMN